MEITEQDKLNNPGVDEHTIQSVKMGSCNK